MKPIVIQVFLLSLSLVQLTTATGPCFIVADRGSNDPLNIARDGSVTESLLPVAFDDCGPIVDSIMEVGYFEESISTGECGYAPACYSNMVLVQSGSCSGVALGDSSYGQSVTTDLCRRPECPEEGAVNCEEIDPVVANATDGWGRWETLTLALGVLILVALVAIAGLLASQNKIEQPARYPQFSVAHRDKVAASIKPGTHASNVEVSSPSGTSAGKDLLSSAGEIGPILSRTRVAIVAALCLVLAVGHVPLALAFGASGLFLPFVAALAWIISVYFGIQAFLGQNSFEAWHKATTVGLVATILGNLIGLAIWMFALSKVSEICRSGCSDDPLYGDPCRRTCGTLGPAMIGPIINLVLLFAFMGFVWTQTRRGVNGNGKVMTFGLSFPTETGFKDVARPPPGGSHGSRRSKGSQRGSKGSRRGGSNRQAPGQA